jgi:hypothetical protein
LNPNPWIRNNTTQNIISISLRQSGNPDQAPEKKESKKSAIPSNPLLEYAKKKEEKKKTSALRLSQSDTSDTSAAAGNELKQALYDEVVSGGEDDGDNEEDFWS